MTAPLRRSLNTIGKAGVQFSVLAALAAALLAGCGGDDASTSGGGERPPAEVAVVTVEPRPITIEEILPGRLEAKQVAQVRARASGIVLERLFREGSEVKAGDVLFRIDPAPLKAALNQARAALARAKANRTQAELTVKRYEPLIAKNAISTQAYDNAVAARELAQAEVAQAEAAVEIAQLNLDYATVEAPISGRIGAALVTVGALVSQAEATHLATIQSMDPIQATLTQSSAEIMRLRRAFEEGRLARVGDGLAKVQLILEGGEAHPLEGTLLFTDMTVNQQTGAVTLKAEFPNPDGALMPGMYVRARLTQGVDDAAITIPQQALSRTSQGATVMLVNDNDAVEIRQVTVRQAYGNNWIIDSGLSGGERVIVEGLQKTGPGATVKTVAWQGGRQQSQAE